MLDKDQKYYLHIPLQQGIVLQRSRSGDIFTNVERLAIHHSPAGFSFGYSGSGPSDLALNIVEGVLIASGYQGLRMTERLFNGYHPFLQAWRLHQSFKQAFIAPLSQEPGEYRLDYETVRAWIYGHMLPEPEELPEAEDADFPDKDVFDDAGRRQGQGY